MSHFAVIAVDFECKHEDALLKAIKKTFGENSKVVVSDTPRKLTGYDSASGKTAHIVIAREDVAKANGGHAYNEVGFKRNQGENAKYDAIWDAADVRPQTQDALKQSYSLYRAEKETASQGWTQIGAYVTEKDGSISFEAVRYV